MNKNFSREIDDILSANTVSRLRRVTYRVFRSMGFRRLAYVHSIAGHPGGFFIYQIGYPSGLAGEYRQAEQQLDDPFPLLTRQSAVPVQWSSTAHSRRLSKRHRRYLARMRNAEIGDGFSVHVSGPNGKDGYFALGYGHYGSEMSHRELTRLQLVCQATHNRLCDLTREDLPKTDNLTGREAQVLFWIARGKTNSVAADILGVSKHTVDTLSKRIFDKLGVRDRLSAVIVGHRIGAVPHNASGSP